VPALKNPTDPELGNPGLAGSFLPQAVSAYSTQRHDRTNYRQKIAYDRVDDLRIVNIRQVLILLD
jgi:hypothetical protein